MEVSSRKKDQLTIIFHFALAWDFEEAGVGTGAKRSEKESTDVEGQRDKYGWRR